MYRGFDEPDLPRSGDDLDKFSWRNSRISLSHTGVESTTILNSRVKGTECRMWKVHIDNSHVELRRMRFYSNHISNTRFEIGDVFINFLHIFGYVP